MRNESGHPSRPEHLKVATESEHVKLTSLHIENIYTHFEWNNDRELNKFDSEAPLDEEEPFHEFKERFERMVFHPLPTERDYEIHTADGELIGIAFISRINTYNRNCFIGLTIGAREYWGRGYGRETLELLLKICFEELGMHRVSTDTFEYNDSWSRLVRNSGFVEEGVEREFLFRGDRFWDKRIFAMLEQEYAAREEWKGIAPA